MADASNSPRNAPTYTIPEERIVSVEHPAIIRNVDKAMETVQGSVGIANIMNPAKVDSSINLFLRPEDPMARPVQSISSASDGVVLKITVPKRTGRRRKKGTNDPFVECDTSPAAADAASVRRPAAKEVLRSLSDNVGNYDVEVVGRVERTHVFRGMPDFVFSTAASPFTNRFRDEILSFDYEKMKNFDLDMSKGTATAADIIPPPSFSHGDIPFNYIYRQNPTVRQAVDTSGNITTVNTQQAAKILTHLVPCDIEEVPSGPRENCPRVETLDKTLRDTIAFLEGLFADRPAWTRRGLRNSVKTLEQRYALRHAIPYVGYIFRSGPWRDAIVKFGHDPRTSPDYRFYQTVMFRILPREPELARDGGQGRRHALPRPADTAQVDPMGTTAGAGAGAGTDGDGDGGLLLSTAESNKNTHLFTGQLPFPRDGRMWMLCDITDPILAGILSPPPPAAGGHAQTGGFLRSSCEILSDGWFGSGTLAKLRTIMRAKIQALVEDRVPDNAEFARLLTLPDHADPTDVSLAQFTFDSDAAATSRDMQLATELRATIKGSATWKLREQGRPLPAPVRAPAADTDTDMQSVSSSPSRTLLSARAAARDNEDSRWSSSARGGADVDEAESEGEEEAMERAELLQDGDAVAAMAAEAAEAAHLWAVDDDEDEDDENDDDKDPVDLDENDDDEID